VVLPVEMERHDGLEATMKIMKEVCRKPPGTRVWWVNQLWTQSQSRDRIQTLQTRTMIPQTTKTESDVKEDADEVDEVEEIESLFVVLLS